MNKCYISNYECDIRIITDFLNSKGIYPENAKVTSELYQDFCGDMYSASWLVTYTSILENFAKWIMDNLNKREEIEHLCD